ncbi:DUF2799 domain-containing protein [Moraxella sp.]|uniref:DUF2799 domain-containing protein n=1 Tax=Moraxella sp. TaxID=479 RepID=UPI002606DDC6|nr:DUF2799 domain-containing protein [Moraxella sp.]MCP3896626.1 DUF2799 domain-containing protein [Moraxella sp.]
MKKPILLSAFVLALAMTGCATKQPQLNVNDCATADWQTIGIKDGQNGYSAQRILSHQKTCQAAGISPNRAAWEEGRQIGLQSYCTKSNAYEMGRRGYELTGVCDHNLEELHHANMMGLQQYEMSQRIHRPYGYGYYGGYPFLPWYFY